MTIKPLFSLNGNKRFFLFKMEEKAFARTNAFWIIKGENYENF